MSDQRPARAYEICECGSPATVVFMTRDFGEVPYCGVPRPVLSCVICDPDTCVGHG